MKKYSFLILLLSILGINVALAECNTYYKVSINIEGKGTIKNINENKDYTEDSTLNIKCQNNLTIKVIPEEGYKLQGLYSGGNYLSSRDNNYGFDVNQNLNIKAVFVKNTEARDNEIVISSKEDNVSINLDDEKDSYKKDTIVKVELKDITLRLSSDIIKNHKEYLTIVAREINKKDMSIKQQRYVKNSKYYNFFIYNNENELTDLKGEVEVSIPYNDSKNAYVYFIDNDGRFTLVDSKYDNETITFKTNHFSVFAISPDKLDEMDFIKGNILSNYKQVIGVIGIISVICLLVVVIRSRKNK